MTRREHLLIIAMEECHEVAQRISKALRFGLTEVQPDQEMNNAERITQEFNDLNAIIEMIQFEDDTWFRQSIEARRFQIEAKKIKVEKFLKYSEYVGTLKNESPISN